MMLILTAINKKRNAAAPRTKGHHQAPAPSRLPRLQANPRNSDIPANVAFDADGHRCADCGLGRVVGQALDRDDEGGVLHGNAHLDRGVVVHWDWGAVRVHLGLVVGMLVVLVVLWVVLGVVGHVGDWLPVDGLAHWWVGASHCHLWLADGCL
jgi:hypothetical protein